MTFPPLAKLALPLLVCTLVMRPALAETPESTDPDAKITKRYLTDALCGHACLNMVLRFFGRSVTMDRLKEMIPSHPEGASVLDLVKAARTLGVDAKPFREEAENLGGLCAHDGIVIIRTKKKTPGGDAKHFVVALPAEDGKLLVLDPFERPVLLYPGDLASAYLGDGLRLENRPPSTPFSFIAAILLAIALGYSTSALLGYARRRESSPQ